MTHEHDPHTGRVVFSVICPHHISFPRPVIDKKFNKPQKKTEPRLLINKVSQYLLIIEITLNLSHQKYKSVYKM